MMYVIYVKLFVCYPEQVGEDMDTYILFVIKVGEDMDTYVKPIQELGGETVYGPPHLTEAWQPCDAGHVIATLKVIAKAKHEAWMMKEYTGKVEYEDKSTKNWQVWESGKITTSEKRILMTWVYGEAWEDFCEPRYDYFRRMAFEKCGMHITKSGKNDDQVTAEGIEDPWQGFSIHGI
jgi:hypothetical protein